MTAIASVLTPKGFIIGADGRETDVHGKIRTNERIKIMSATAQGIQAAFGFAGFVTVGSFNFHLEAESVRHEMVQIEFSSLADYALAFANKLYYRLIEHMAGINLASLPDGNLVCLLMVGYAGGTAETTSIGFPCVAGVLKKPSVKCATGSSSAHFTMIGGYEEVYNRMCDENLMIPSATLSEGATLINRYIESCRDNSAVVGDALNGIGGHIHIAAVTPEASIWLVGPKV